MSEPETKKERVRRLSSALRDARKALSSLLGVRDYMRDESTRDAVEDLITDAHWLVDDLETRVYRLANVLMYGEDK